MTVLAIARYEAEAPFARARDAAARAERHIVGMWMPFPGESLAMGGGADGVLPVVIVAGVFGLLALLGLEAWSSAVAYPLNSGGRPLLSWPAFVPAVVELGALIAAAGGVVMLFRNARLTRLHAAAFDLDEVLEASQGSFVLALACDAGEDANAAMALLAEGAAHSRLIER